MNGVFCQDCQTVKHAKMAKTGIEFVNSQKSIGEFVVLISLTLILILFQYEYIIFSLSIKFQEK